MRLGNSSGMRNSTTRTGAHLHTPPHYEGDLIFSLILEGGYSHCLETGFATGSTAVYMLFATKEVEGTVVSIDIAGQQRNDLGLRNVERSGFKRRHTFLENDSIRVLAKFMLEERGFDFVYIDGWKTFDHLAFELYAVDQMLETGGVVFFDDTYLPSVRQSIRMLQRSFAYEEVDYTRYGENWRLRLRHVLTMRSIFRPFRAFRKTCPTSDQPRKKDYDFF